MSDLKRFYKIFGIQVPIEEERKRFVERINQSIFKLVENSREIPYKNVLWAVCYELGLRFDDYWYVGVMDRIFHPLCKLTGNDFLKTLEVLIPLYKFFDGKPNGQEWISSEVEKALSLSGVDLGVKWKDGMFYKSGAKLLDEKLVEDPLDWLESYPLVKQNYLKAIDA